MPTPRSTRRALTASLAVLGVASAPGITSAQIRDAASLRPRIDAVVQPYVDAGDFSGVVAVRRDGEPPLVLPYGEASVELGVPHRADDVFLVGSVSKQFTAVAILLLEEDGRLSTGDRLSAHLPEFPRAGEITVEQLLTHTSGVADVYSLERFGASAGRVGTFAEVIDALGRAGLTHDPGTAYAYSNGGYSVLAALVERASGMGYGAFLQERIFGPLGMTSSAHDAPGPTVERRVPGYDPWGVDRLTPAIPVSPAYTTGSGSLWSSATDLLTWNEALHTGKVLSEASYRKLVHDYGHGYGFGVSVFQRFGREVLGHDGRVSGFSSDVARYLEDRVTVVVLGNVQSVARDEIRRGVAAAVFVEPEPDADRPDLAIGWSGSLDELAGTYAFGPGFAVTIRASDGRLLARANQGGESELVPTASGEWFSRMLYATVHFDHDESGRVDALVWGRGERAPIGRRTP